MGLGRSALSTGFDAQVVSTGAGHLLVPLIDQAAVDGAIPDARKLTAILEDVDGEGCYLYSLDSNSPAAVAYARFFNPIMGISEDPATGTAAGPLVSLLISRGHCPDGVTAIVEQGYSLGRPSRIHVTVNGTDVKVSGSGVVVADGVLHL
ncbi:PhzF family phenazine biosynthesis protein [Cryobacterium luteum]|uniref:PhzF family phenazine biosynthesis protein n=1 Tax=Cryobacterium luteum TaxID=1424661 RepID=A0A5F0D1K1_9MICO|nr:PhzF family phenazine biosynthesis protein [Cryobacterium luteum]